MITPFKFIEFATQNVRHSGRPFYQHLKGTYDLLEAWGNPRYICYGGLAHSIYGTRYFKEAVIPTDKRALVQQMIGFPAEELAFQFCTGDRKNLFPDQPRAIRRALLEIEAANLLEQKATVRPLLRLIKAAGRNGLRTRAADQAISAYLFLEAY